MNPDQPAVPDVCSEGGCERPTSDRHWHPKDPVMPQYIKERRAKEQENKDNDAKLQAQVDNIKKNIFGKD